MTRACAECAHYKDSLCKRYPPQIVVLPERDGGALKEFVMYPSVDDLDWCGEFKPNRRLIWN